MTGRTGQRRLAAIVAMDVVGYSRMMGADEEGTLARVKAVLAELLRPTMESFQGRLFKSSGDGFLLEFSSVVDAFRFAAQFQELNGRRNAELTSDTALAFRVGLNIGDVIVDEGDVFGDGVNIAARLEQIADPGGICLSDRAWRDLRNLEVEFEDLGPRRLKNIAEPIHVYRAVQPAPAAASRIEKSWPPFQAGGARNGVRRRRAAVSRRGLAVAAVLGLLAILLAAGWWLWLRAPAAAPHGMTVRLAGFRLLSPDLPSALRDTVDAEIAAAFNADGVVGVAHAAATGAAPGFALGGTIQRDGPRIRVITNLVNERSGATVWGDNFEYDGSELARVPRHIAVDAGNVVRCGLFGASTYRKPLPDQVLRDYLQFCQGHWNPDLVEGRKALVPAQRVVAALPDFSWGWAAVAGGYWKVASNAVGDRAAAEARASGRAAADRAVAIDPNNTEALYIKAMLFEREDWGAREALFKRAVAARRLDCGCEYHQYGWMLLNVGRVVDAVERLRQANDMLALYIYTPLNLADALLAAGKPDEARTFYDASIQLAPDANFTDRLRSYAAMDLGDVETLRDPRLPIPSAARAALVAGFEALRSGDTRAKADAVRALKALPADQQSIAVARLLVNLGAVADAFPIVVRLATRWYPGPTLLWYRDMRPILSDPRFPQLAQQLGLMDYWRQSRARPDVCSEAAPPPFCRAI